MKAAGQKRNPDGEFLDTLITTPSNTSCQTAMTEALFLFLNVSLEALQLRKRLAEVCNDSPKRVRRCRKVEGATIAEQEVERKLRKLDRETRWQALLFFSSFQVLPVLHSVYGADLSTDTYDYTYGRARVMDNIKAYKCKVLERMHVRLHDGFYVIQESDLALVSNIPVLRYRSG